MIRVTGLATAHRAENPGMPGPITKMNTTATTSAAIAQPRLPANPRVAAFGSDSGIAMIPATQNRPTIAPKPLAIPAERIRLGLIGLSAAPATRSMPPIQ